MKKNEEKLLAKVTSLYHFTYSTYSEYLRLYGYGAECFVFITDIFIIKGFQYCVVQNTSCANLQSGMLSNLCDKRQETYKLSLFLSVLFHGNVKEDNHVLKYV